MQGRSQGKLERPLCDCVLRGMVGLLDDVSKVQTLSTLSTHLQISIGLLSSMGRGRPPRYQSCEELESWISISLLYISNDIISWY